MNNNTDNRVLYENASTNYHFEPIDHDFSSTSTLTQTNNSHLIQRPIPLANYPIIERPNKQQYVSQTKRNLNIQSYALPRSMTSGHLGNNHTTNKFCYYPSVQDVLDALNRSSFDKESFV